MYTDCRRQKSSRQGAKPDLSGCIFDGVAVKSAFALLSTKVTKPERGNLALCRYPALIWQIKERGRLPMERTISAMIGKGSVNHNTRAFTAKNVDKNRSVDNVEFRQEDIKQVYHKLFDEALERYNAKQKRKDRVIDNYYEKIRRGKQEKLFHEVIFQIGNKDDMNAKSEDGLLAKRILTEFMDEFQARNLYLYVFSAHLHMDEETPHLHIDFAPYITESKRGLDTRVSLKSDNQALRQKYNDLQQNNVQLEKQQNELKSHIEQMVQSEQLLQRDVRKYDEAPEWQLPEPGAFASAKSFRDKVVMPFVNKLKTLIKNLTIQCVRLKEEVLQLRKEKKRLPELFTVCTFSSKCSGSKKI